MNKFALSCLIIVSVLLSSKAHALSLAPSYTCCENWAASGAQPDSCEPTQTVEYCEEQLNNPQPDYFASCWPASEDPECRAAVDERIEQLRAERQKNPIDLDGNPVSKFDAVKIPLAIAGALGVVITIVFLVRRRGK